MTGAPGAVGDDVNPIEAYERLSKTHDAQLVDVRTEAEWDAVGVPDLAAIGKAPLFVQWHGSPDFLDELATALEARGIDRNAPLYFLCRSGNRSGITARLAAANGYPETHNVIEGFEGPPTATAPVGWKARGLPWKQR